MGIPTAAAGLLIDEAKRRPFSGSVLQLGRSSVYFTRSELENLARKRGFALASASLDGRSHDPRLAAQGCLDDQGLFRSLGFDTVGALDIADWEGAEIIHDLNTPIPAELESTWDVVFETGTTVQIFDLRQVLANLARLVRVGGRIVHALVPSHNHVDLGFYMPSPTLYSDFYAANGFTVASNLLCLLETHWHRGRLMTPRCEVRRYTPGSLDHLSYGRFGASQLALFVVAEKTAESTWDQVPQLGQYRQSWEEFQAARATDGEAAVAGLQQGWRSRGLAARWEQLLERSPALDRAWIPIKRWREKLGRLGPRRWPPKA